MEDGEALKLADCVNETCPWSGRPVQADSLALYGGHVVGFCNPGCRDKFVAAAAHFDRAIKTQMSAKDALREHGAGTALMANTIFALKK